MENEEKKDLVKLAIVILSQAVIDAYLGSRSIKKKTMEWFAGEDYHIIARILMQNGVRVENIFDLPYSWGDIPNLISKRAELLYVRCKAVNYLEDTNENKYLLGKAIAESSSNKNLIKVSTRKKKYKGIKGLQMVNSSLL